MLVALLVACSTSRMPIPLGTVPEQGTVSAEEERFGQEVFSELSRQYKISRDSAMINRVRDIADRLANTAGAAHNQWNVYVFDDPETKNAAATKGNFIFVWSGLLSAVQNDDELASIIAHEVGHVLAKHPEATPEEEANRIVSGVFGEVAGQVISVYDPAFGLLADIGKALVTSLLNAALVNPEQRRQELEADQIGLFLMADGGYDPEKALQFWQRVKDDPSFGGSPLQFLSTHPSSEARLEQMQKILPQAQDRFHKIAPHRPTPSSEVLSDQPLEQYRVRKRFTTVWVAPDRHSAIVVDLPRDTRVGVKSTEKGWANIDTPVRGYVPLEDLKKSTDR